MILLTKAKAKGITKAAVTRPTKVQPIWQIGILFPNGQKIVKTKCSLNDLFETYFLNLDSNAKNYTAEELLDKYKENYESKNIKVQIVYIDSWGNKWTGKVAWPSDKKFIEYLNKRIND